MRILRRRWIAAMLLTSGAVLGAAATMGDQPWIRLPRFGTDTVTADVHRSPLARLIIRNEELEPLRGRIVGPGSVTRAFLVPPQEVHDVSLQAGDIVVEFDTAHGVARRAMHVRAGEVATVDYHRG